jgi:serine/threonine protein kinase
MSLDSVTLFHDALRGLRFLHSHGWVHLDIKPHNIGVLTNPLRAVLLDLGQLSTLPAGYTLAATPGCTGTINYLSPEQEIDEYDHGADIWPMGVIGYELTYGHHPFLFATNPWRSGNQYENLRPLWRSKYDTAIDRLSLHSRHQARAHTQLGSYRHRKPISM